MVPKGLRGTAGERGSATVEFALALPAVVLVLAMGLGCAGWVLRAAEAQQAAGQGARVAITGTDAQAVAAAGGNAQISRNQGWVTVCVSVPAAGVMPGASRCATAKDQP